MPIIDDILRREGSDYTNHPADRGGPTKFGITLGKLTEVRGHATAANVEALTEAEARAIYEQEYIVKPGFAGIKDDSLRELVVDTGVNSGPSRAARWLQEAAGETADGRIGPKTLAAVNAMDAAALYRKVLASRVRFIGRLIADDPKQAVFAAGWANRLAEFVEA